MDSSSIWRLSYLSITQANARSLQSSFCSPWHWAGIYAKYRTDRWKIERYQSPANVCISTTVYYSYDHLLEVSMVQADFLWAYPLEWNHLACPYGPAALEGVRPLLAALEVLFIFIFEEIIIFLFYCYLFNYLNIILKVIFL